MRHNCGKNGDFLWTLFEPAKRVIREAVAEIFPQLIHHFSTARLPKTHP
jgi:hypothetical protein